MSDTNTTPSFVNPLRSAKGLARINALWVLALLAAFGPLCTDMYLPALPHIASDLGISVALAQTSMTTCLLGLALGQVFIGPISDGKGRHHILVGAMVVFTLASIFCAITTNGLVFLGLRFIQGLAGAGGVVLSRAICCDTYRGVELTQFMSVLMAIHSVGPTLGPVLGGFIAGSVGWQAIFWVLAAIGVYLAISSFRLPETLDPQQRVPGGVLPALLNMHNLFHEKAFMAYTGVQGFTMAGFFSYISASPFVFQNIYGLSMEQFSLVFGGIALCVTFVALTAGPLANRFGNRMTLLVFDIVRACAAASVLAVVLLEPSSPIPLIAVLLVMVSMQGITLTACFSLAIESQVTGAGAASGILGVATFLFGAIASPLAGVCGPDSALPLGILCAVTGCISLCMTIIGNKAYMHSPARGLSLVRRLHKAREERARLRAKAEAMQKKQEGK